MQDDNINCINRSRNYKNNNLEKEERGQNMNIKRVLSGVILFPIVALVIIFGNKYVVDIAIAIVAILSIHEFYKAFHTSRKSTSY